MVPGKEMVVADALSRKETVADKNAKFEPSASLVALCTAVMCEHTPPFERGALLALDLISDEPLVATLLEGNNSEGICKWVVELCCELRNDEDDDPYAADDPLTPTVPSQRPG